MIKELGKVLIDIAKLVIGGVILASLMKQNIKPELLFIIGSIVSIIMICTGLILIAWKEKNNYKK